jgi:hypothetical protein
VWKSVVGRSTSNAPLARKAPANATRVFGFIPECRSASFRNQRSASPESPRGVVVAVLTMVFAIGQG